MQHCSSPSECAGIYWQRSYTRNQPIPTTQFMRGPSVNKLGPEEERLMVARLHSESVKSIKEHREKLRDKWRQDFQRAKECRWPPSPPRSSKAQALAQSKASRVVKLRDLVQRLHPQKGSREERSSASGGGTRPQCVSPYSQFDDPHLQNFWRRRRILLKAERSFCADALLGRLLPMKVTNGNSPPPSAAISIPQGQATAQEQRKGKRTQEAKLSDIRPSEASWDAPRPNIVEDVIWRSSSSAVNSREQTRGACDEDAAEVGAAADCHFEDVEDANDSSEYGTSNQHSEVVPAVCGDGLKFEHSSWHVAHGGAEEDEEESHARENALSEPSDSAYDDEG